MLDTKKGSGWHYRLRLGDALTTIQSDLNLGRIGRILKQLKIERSDL